ncbi:MAG TPA: hypothetical protein VKY65_06325 [Alphaproteobacteria bacterium]|nr:hypothetical protein [Alphaproteobacteria bacterium]
MTTGAQRPIIIDSLPTETIPYEVGSLCVTEAGTVTIRENTGALRFHFTFADIRFSALARRGESAASLRLCGCLGVLPYSAESASLRRHILAVLHEANRAAHGRLIAADNQNILFLDELAVPLPFTPMRLVTQLVLGLLDLKPHLDRLRATLGEASAASAA